MSEWQPIETCPKGEDAYLLVHNNREDMFVCYWSEEPDNAWAWHTLDGPSYHKDAFSHWMPLPEPPK